MSSGSSGFEPECVELTTGERDKEHALAVKQEQLSPQAALAGMPLGIPDAAPIPSALDWSQTLQKAIVAMRERAATNSATTQNPPTCNNKTSIFTFP